MPRTLPFITFTGNVTGDPEPPSITGNDTASVFGKDGKPLRTLQSATVAVDADYFVAVNIKFEVIRFLLFITLIFIYLTFFFYIYFCNLIQYSHATQNTPRYWPVSAYNNIKILSRPTRDHLLRTDDQ